jgi:Domain of unknown function (DUF4259)
MGAWGTGHFENDDALDLAADVRGRMIWTVCCAR